MEDNNHSPETEEEVVSKALTIGMIGFLLLMFGGAVLERTGYYPGAMRLFPLALTLFALLGTVWLLWKSPMDQR